MANVTYKDVMQMKERAHSGYLSKMRRTFKEMDRLYNLEFVHDLKLPAGIRTHVPSTAPSLVDTFVAQVRTTDPKITLGTAGRVTKDKEKTSNRTAFGQHVMQMIDQFEDEPVWEYLRFDLGNLGAACVRIAFDDKRWPEDAADQPDAWPFVLKIVNPSTVVIPPGFRWPYPYVIETQRRTFVEIQQQYPDWKPNAEFARVNLSNSMKPDTTIDITFYWDNADYYVFAGGEQVYHSINPLGMPPYIWTFSRLGHKSDSSDPDTQAVGILRHAASELVSEFALKTYADLVWRQTAIPPLMGTPTPEDMKAQWSAEWGKYIHLNSPEDKVEWLDPPVPNPAMWALLGELSNSIQASTIADVLQGESGGSRAAAQYGFQVGQARLKTNAIKQGLERMAGRVLAIIGLYYTKVLETSIRTDNNTVNKADIEDYMDWRVTFENVDPRENSQRIQDGLAIWQSGALPWALIAKDYWAIEDVPGEWRNLLSEKMIQQLVDSGAAAQALMQDMAAQEQAAVLDAAQGQAAQQQTDTTEGVLGAPAGAPDGAPFGNVNAPGGANDGNVA